MVGPRARNEKTGPRILRVFPRRTSYTPDDGLTHIGWPPMVIPICTQVHVSVTFTWDVPLAVQLRDAWQQAVNVPVYIGGPALGSGGPFLPGKYVREGIVFTSRGCNFACPWCLVREREGPLTLLPISPGHIIQDNNFLLCPTPHRHAVYAMLREQPRAAVFAGGLDARLVTDEIAEELRHVRIAEVFLACDSDAALPILERAVEKLAFLKRRQLRCYVLCAYNGQTIAEARARLEQVWRIGCLPFAQLYQPSDRYITYSVEWKRFIREWSRPAAMFAATNWESGQARRLW